MNPIAVPWWRVRLVQYLMVAIMAAWGTFCTSSLCHAIGDTWTQKENFVGTARNNAVAFSIGSKGYVGTGYDDSYRKDFWEYNPTSNTWTQRADFGGTGRYCAVGFSIGTKGYLGTGFDGGPTKDFWEYDPSSNAWARKADFGGAARSYAVGFSIGTKGYVGTGAIGSVTAKDFWEYNPTSNTWTQKADFGGTGRYCAASFSIGTKGYVGTGYDGTWAVNDFWEYDPSFDTWIRKADLGEVGRWSAFGFSIGTKGYVGTGYDGSYKNDLWEYVPSSNTWARKADFGGAARFCAVGFSIGATGYVGTGSSSSFFSDFWEYASSGYNLAVFKSGTGAGTVTSSPSGIDCGSICSASFDQNAVATLTALADKGSVFTGWTGDCSGNATTSVLAMNVSKSCAAIFDEVGGFVSIPLSAGWNFISFPKKPPNTTIEAILADVSPSIRVVWGYDNESKIWKRHKPWGVANTLLNMEVGKGYWIYANNDSAISMAGCKDPSATVHLYEGWNLVGYSGTDNNDIVTALDAISDKWSVIWNWDKGVWKIRKGPDIHAALFLPELTTLNTGKAYWIKTRVGKAVDWVQQAGATPPGAPTGLMAAEVSGNQINLSWADASGNVGVAGYYVYQGTTRIADAKATSYSITDFDANAQSSYTIRAYDASGNISASSALLIVGGGSNTLTAAASGTGSGTITSVPAGINCGSTCSVTLIKGTSVTLTANPNADSSFAGWSGACAGKGACAATIDEAKSVAAEFTSSPLLLTVPVGAVVPLTPLQITASGLIQDASVSVSFSNNSGFSVKDDPIRVGNDGTIVVAVPLYIDPVTQEITAGTVDVVVTQGTRSSPSVTLSIQDLPPLSAYDARHGEISKAYFAFSAMQLGRRSQRLQVGEALSVGAIDTSAAQAITNNLLKKSISVRYDVDSIFLDNGVVIDGGTLPDGTQARFDKDSVEMMDRILGVWLSQQFGSVISSSANAQSKVTSSTRRSEQAYPQGSSLSPADFRALIRAIEVTKGSTDLITALIKGPDEDHPFLDPAMTVIKGAQGYASLFATKLSQAKFVKSLGAGLALFEILHAGMDVGFDLLELYGFGITDGGATYDRLKRDSDKLYEVSKGALIDPLVGEITKSFDLNKIYGSAFKLLLSDIDFASATQQAIMDNATTEALGTYSPSSSVGQVSGVVNGIQQGPSTPSVSVDLCCFGSEALGISGVADPSGNYNLLMPLGVSANFSPPNIEWYWFSLVRA